MPQFLFLKLSREVSFFFSCLFQHLTLPGGHLWLSCHIRMPLYLDFDGVRRSF